MSVASFESVGCAVVSGLDEFEFTYATCQPGTKASCYTGPAGTEDIGLCAAGEKLCNPAGDGYGPCVGDVLPALGDDCVTGLDGDCNGTITAKACEGKPSGSSFGGLGLLRATSNDSLPNGEFLIGGSFSNEFPFAGETLQQQAQTTGFVGRFDASDAPVRGAAFSYQSNPTDVTDVAGTSTDLAAIVSGANTPFPSQSYDLEARVWPIGGDPSEAKKATIGRVDAIGESEWMPNPVGLVAAGDSGFVVGITNARPNNLELGGFTFDANGNPTIVIGGLAADASFPWAFDVGKNTKGNKKLTDIVVRGNRVLLGIVASSTIDVGCGAIEGNSTLAVVASFDVGESPPRCLWSQGFPTNKDGAQTNYDSSSTDVALASNGDAWVTFTSNADLPALAGDAATGGDTRSAVVVSLGQNGTPGVAARLRADSNSVDAQRIAIDPFGNVVLGGCFRGTLSFGTEERTAPSAQENCNAIYLAKMSALGKPVWLRSLLSDGGLVGLDLSIGPSARIHATATLYENVWFDVQSGDPIASEQSLGALHVILTP